MSGKINIIALDLNLHEEGWRDYAPLSAPEKINQLANHVQAAITEIEEGESTLEEKDRSLNIVAWREYGIGESNSRFVTNDVKNRFKQVMLELTKKHPSLAIVAGTIANKKHFDQFEILREVESEYKTLAHIEAEEKKEGEKQFTAHLKKVTSYSSEEHKGVDILRNSCFVFQHGRFQRHDKTTPYDETTDYLESDAKTMVFRPGKSETRSPLIEIVHPYTMERILIGVEICREHTFQVLKNHRGPTPLIHFVLSDSVVLGLESLVSDYTVQFDSRVKPKLIVTQRVLEEDRVTLYQANGFSNTHDLVGPLEPLYPFDRAVKDWFETHLKQSSSKKQSFLQNMHTEFLKSCRKGGQQQFLSKFLKTHKDELGGGRLSSIFVPNSLYRSLKQIVENEEKRLKADDQVDIHSRQERPVLKQRQSPKQQMRSPRQTRST